MARKSEPGIPYFSLYCNHIDNKKIKLLMHETASDGYWIWSCIVSKAYAIKGYYFDTNDNDEMTLFADEVCKRSIETVQNVIAVCLKRSLFDKGIYDKYKLLTSDRIQENYLLATAERRRKGTIVPMYKELILIDADTRNLEIVPMVKPDTSTDNKNSSAEQSKNAEEEAAAQKRKDAEAVLVRRKDFITELQEFVPLYGRDMVNHFFNYWSELTPSGKKMRKETEKTWETKKRLATWARNGDKYQKGNNTAAANTPPGVPLETPDERKALEEKTRKLAKD